ncbi:DNA-directed RNA polymerase subunit delta [Alicyclobacillus cycloheptanicus]|uniref:Probable DNA-directed RNA polymerase subunit delta n=1 Tax=Alicyclobacillus cycloheptanicus TaxID=1457 RepID=A0ABT9XGM7_9BACL|nr:DNA-directed RNA polymerase subunit delta [Alicyclobacillus cycloheptanicus]MDQ0189458.1 DNA-directed RNA polymerase subunit delta [Alicyclobacillus cycloheptanicus]WDM02325.1 DNA-directed RNA polymerase subunit delta [Alicyclobacillus cycloheptanicus]
MAVTLSKSQDEIREMPLVELVWEILKEKKEPYYFRDLMSEVQALRGMTDEEAMDVMARLYTEINIDGRFICIGQNVWGLKRWYPVDKVAEKSVTSKRFVRRSGDAFSDDDEDLEADFEDPEVVDEEEEDLFLAADETDEEDVDVVETVDADAEEEEEVFEDEAEIADDEEAAEYDELELEEEAADEDEDDAY